MPTTKKRTAQRLTNEKLAALCHCEERTEGATREPIVSRWTLSSLSIQLLKHSGSPRATPSRWQASYLPH
ncbi:hypothetical protein [Candidatus Seribacter sulfatis]|uniref:hypothetical protein n=1 Tax=Candidatus Seribacter sulfatis TaxID=3381756 RepID=UPI00389AF5C3